MAHFDHHNECVTSSEDSSVEMGQLQSMGTTLLGRWPNTKYRWRNGVYCGDWKILLVG